MQDAKSKKAAAKKPAGAAGPTICPVCGAKVRLADVEAAGGCPECGADINGTPKK